MLCLLTVLASRLCESSCARPGYGSSWRLEHNTHRCSPFDLRDGNKTKRFLAFINKTQIHTRHCANLNTVYVNTCSWTSPVWCLAWRNSCFCRRNKRPHDGWSHTYFFFSKCWYFIWCCNNERELVQGTHFSYSKPITGFLIWPVYIVELILLLLPKPRPRLWEYLGLSWLQWAGWQTWR